MTIREYRLENCRVYIRRKYSQLTQKEVDNIASNMLENKLIFVSKSNKSNANIKPLIF